MTRIIDPLAPSGLGFISMQHHRHLDDGWEPSARLVLYGTRTVARQDDDGQFGDWVYEDESAGDVLGGHLWPAASRDTGGWSFGGMASVVGGRLVPRGPRKPKDTRGTNPFSAGAADPSVGGGVDPDAGGASGGPPDTSDKAGGGGGQKAPDPQKLANKKPNWKDAKAAAAEEKKSGFGYSYKYKGVVYGPGPPPAGVGLNPQIQAGIFKPGDPALLGGIVGLNVFKFAMIGVNPQYLVGGPVGIRVEPYSINIVGAASHRDFIETEQKDGRTFFSFADTQSFAPPSQSTLPLEGDWDADDRFASITPKKPNGWPDFPLGFYGRTEPATDANEQIDLFLPCDPRLVTANSGPSPTLGSVVADVHSSGYLDLSRHARLHSFLRVVKAPKRASGAASSAATSVAVAAATTVVGALYGAPAVAAAATGLIAATRSALPTTPGSSAANWLAWNLGFSGMRDTHGGIVCDHGEGGTASAGQRTMALVSSRYGGFLDVGHSSDIHRWGTDGDGNPINLAHIWTGALFRDRGSNEYDGPLDFEHAWPDPGELPYYVRTHIGWNVAKWSFWSTSMFETPESPRPVPVTPPDPPGVPTPPPTRGKAWHPDGEPDPVIEATADPTQFRRIGLTHMETAFPSVLFRAQLFLEGEIDFAHTLSPTPRDLAAYRLTSPIVARFTAYGAQGGDDNGPYINPGTGSATAGGTPFVYTQEPGESCYAAGTAAGTVLFGSPEGSLQYADASLGAPGLTRSAATLGIATGNALAFGLPNLATGGINTGYKIDVDATGYLIFTPLTSSGGAGTAVNFHDIGEVKHQAGAFGAGDLNDIADDTAQKQVGIRTGGGSEAFAVNIGGTVFTAALT